MCRDVARYQSVRHRPPSEAISGAVRVKERTSPIRSLTRQARFSSSVGADASRKRAITCDGELVGPGGLGHRDVHLLHARRMNQMYQAEIHKARSHSRIEASWIIARKLAASLS